MTDTATTAETAVTIKDGWRTSEFWVQKLAMLLSALFATDVIPTEGAIMKVAIVAAFMFTSMGYTVARTKAKA